MELTIKSIEDMLRTCVINFKGNWDDHLPLIDLSCNNSYYASIGMIPFESLYGRRCRYAIGCFEVGDFSLLGPQIVYDSTEKFQLIRERSRRLKVGKNHMPTIERGTLNFK